MSSLFLPFEDVEDLEDMEDVGDKKRDRSFFRVPTRFGLFAL
jgi:hypothetical protein